VVAVVLLVLVCLASPPAIAADHPPIDLPVRARHANYGRGGSCGFAAAEDLLTLGGRPDLANWVRRHYEGPSQLCPDRIICIGDVAERLGLSYDYTYGDGHSADVAWLEAVSRRHLGAVLSWRWRDERGWHYDGQHAVTFLGFDADGDAWLINCNCPDHTWRFPRAEFLEIWTRCYANAFTFEW
jgi:hypothetical protein